MVCGSSLGAATPVLPNLPKEDPYLFRLSEELDNLTRLSLALQTQSQQRFKGEGASIEEKHVEADYGDLVLVLPPNKEKWQAIGGKLK